MLRTVDRTSLNAQRRTGAFDPHIVIADVDLSAHMVIFEELSEGKDWNRVLFVVHARDGHVLSIDVVCERLIANL